MAVFCRSIALMAAIVTVMVWCAAGTWAADESALVVKPLPGRVLSVPAKGNVGSSVPAAAAAHPGQEEGATAANCPPLVIKSANQLPDGTIQRPYLFRIMTSGSTPPVTFALLKQYHLPSGLKLERSGLLTGIPQEAGEFVFAIAAVDGCPQGSQSSAKRFVLTIKEATPEATPSVMIQEATIPQKPVETVNGADGITITRLGLAFENGQTSIAVSRDRKIPSVVAHLELQGRGVIAGYWIAPGNARIFFKQPVSAPETRLILPAGTMRPSGSPGMHAIRIVLTAPPKEFPGAVVRYMVRPAMPPPGAYVEGQLVVTVPLKAKARMAAELGTQFGLRLLESHVLVSLSQAILVFETRGDIMALADQMAGEADVLLAQPNQIFHTLAEPKSPLQSLSRQLNFPQLHRQGRGRGVTIAIIDTGVDNHHEDLRANVREARNFIPEDPYRAEIHGTAVAGVIAAALNGTGIAGLAPEALIVALPAGIGHRSPGTGPFGFNQPGHRCGAGTQGRYRQHELWCGHPGPTGRRPHRSREPAGHSVRRAGGQSGGPLCTGLSGVSRNGGRRGGHLGKRRGLSESVPCRCRLGVCALRPSFYDHPGQPLQLYGRHLHQCGGGFRPAGAGLGKASRPVQRRHSCRLRRHPSVDGGAVGDIPRRIACTTPYLPDVITG